LAATLHRLLKVQRGEGWLVFAFGLLLFGNSMAIQISSVLAISGFLDESGVNGFLIVLLFDMLVVLVMTALQSLIIDRFNRVHLMRYVSLGFALTFVLLWLMIALNPEAPLAYSLLYIVAEQQILFFPLILWTLAGDIFDMAQTKRLFPVINSLRFIGRVLGLAIVASAGLLAVAGISSSVLLLLNAAFYFAAFALITLRFKRTVRMTPLHAPIRETVMEGWKFIKEVPVFRFLTLAVLLISSSDIVVEFRFYAVIEQNLAGAQSYETFFSLYRIVIGLLCFAVSGFIVARLLHHMGLKNAFILMPLALMIAAVIMLIATGVPGVVVAMGLMQIVRDTVYDSARQTFNSVVPNERRGRVGILLDSYVFAIGTILGVLLTGAAVILSGRLGIEAHPVYLGYVILASALALWAIFQLRKVYESSLLNWRLRRRQRTSSVLNRLEF
jgi:ATP:ADP antiporter, AAA family